MTTFESACSICGAAALHDQPEFSALPRVTSDCEPFPAGGRLMVCGACGAVQKLGDSRWRAEIATIYSDFALDQQAGGEEQLIFDAAGIGRPRSYRLIDALDQALGTKRSGRLLDFGCGAGATLKAFGRRRPEWELYGVELSAANEPLLGRINGFKKLYTGSVAAIDNTFDVITLVHSLAHVIEPVTILRGLAQRLEPGGLLLIQTPDAAQNPYYLLVADVLVHFDADTLGHATSRAGLAAHLPISEPIVKELTYLGKRAEATRPPPAHKDAAPQMERTDASIRWLTGQLETARRVAASAKGFGIFGSSISASWLAGGIGERVDFFVDEDPRRLGRRHLGRSIVSIEGIPSGATVFVPLIERVAKPVMERLRARGIACAAA